MSELSYMNSAIAIMKQAGWRITEQRKSMYSILSDSEGPLTPKEIMQKHKSLFPDKSMDLVTIYRIMDKFQEIGLIHKIGNGSQYVVCEHLDCRSSFHVIEVCKNCDSVSEKHVPMDLISPLFDYIKKNHEFVSAKHSFSVEGYCKNCV